MFLYDKLREIASKVSFSYGIIIALSGAIHIADVCVNAFYVIETVSFIDLFEIKRRRCKVGRRCAFGHLTGTEVTVFWEQFYKHCGNSIYLQAQAIKRTVHKALLKIQDKQLID
ncbi:hypothetical protein ILUMI_18810, partial [Ignelater luminosus]